MAHSIGKTIAELRKEKGWTQLELAEKLQVSDKTISKWEKDGGSPSIEFFPKLANLFNVTIDYLMAGNNQENVKIDNNISNKGEVKMLTEQYLYKGILDIEKVVAENNYLFVEKSINENPIHIVELIYKFLEENNWRKLFEFFLDNNASTIASTIAMQRFELSKKQMLDWLWKDDLRKSVAYGGVSEKIRAYRKLNTEYLALDYSTIKTFSTFEQVIEYLKDKRVDILSEIKTKIAYQNIQNELSKEYFEKQIKNENFEIVIIKLCVLLETKLRSKYNLDSEVDFSEILERYCVEYLQDEKIVSLLHKLRKSRNNLVHPDQNEIMISLDELRGCLDYILNLA